LTGGYELGDLRSYRRNQISIQKHLILVLKNPSSGRIILQKIVLIIARIESSISGSVTPCQRLHLRYKRHRLLRRTSIHTSQCAENKWDKSPGMLEMDRFLLHETVSQNTIALFMI
jgi:hypothetical protein